MKKRILCMLLIIVMVISLLPTTAMATTPDLVINTVADLENFRNSVNNGKNYSGKLIMLGANLDLSGKNWTPIGKGSNSFQGTFDGNGYIISNLTITNGTGSDGLFGVLYSAHVKNLGLENVSIQSSGSDVGGLAGKATGGSISQCYVTGTVQGSGGVAGILGSTQSSYNPTTISNCYARVDLTGTGGTKDTAGISGWNYSTGVTITNCYSACTGEKRPIAGWSDGSPVQNNRFQNTFFDKSLSPNFSDGVGRVDLGKTSDKLREQSTFTGWDFVNVWNIDPTGVINSGYPYLRMKSVPTSAASYTVVVTFKIEGGKWADGTTVDKTVNVKLSAGKGTLNESSVPTGMTADAGYGNGSWDAIPATTANGITEAVTYTYKFFADQVAPTVGKTDETISGKADGTITGITANMEYRKEGENAYTAVNSSAIENLAAGKYYVRYAGNSNHNPSADTEVIIAEGRKLLVTYKVDGVTFVTVEVSYGDNADAPQLPGKEGYTGTWNGDGKNIVADTTINAVYTPNQYTITFDTDGGSEIAAITQDYGTAVTTPADPTKTGYTFAGWDAEIPATMPAENVIVKAKWTVNQYTITFLDEDGTVLQSSEVAYGEKPVYTGKTPTKTATAQYTYTFNGWDKEVSAITGEVTYTATYSSTVNKYTVKFVDEDGTVLQTGEVAYGETPAYTGETPAKAATAQYTYTFAGWDKTIAAVTGEATYKATYSSTVNKYTVTYKADGKVVATVEVEHGKDATAPEIPAKEGYTETAPTWDKDGKSITADTEINAVYTINKYTVTYKADGEVVDTVEVEHGKDAAAPEIPAKAGHTAAWDKDGKNITADTEINAVYTINKYTVTYKADGKVVKTVEVEHGKDATAPEIPAKEGYTETAPKWDKDGKNITADTEINAVYTKNQPGEYADVTPDTNVGGGKVAEEIEELKEKVPFTQEEEKQIEYGADVEVWLEIKDISDSVSSEEKAKVEEKLGDADVALYLDIAMFKQVGENKASRLTQLSDKVQITFKLDDSYINTDKDVIRTYSIIHVHDGKAEVITPVFDANAKTLSFQTDRFSTYALVYTDVVNTPPAETPATGDSFQPAFWIACMTLSIFGIAVLLLDAKRRHAR